VEIGSAPLRVGLLGLGTVGLGVYRELAARPDLFEVVKIAVRRPSKHAGEHAPEDLLTTEPAQVLAAGCDVVIEALGGRQPAARLIESALRAGTHVITANKLVIAQDGARLRSLAGASGASLLYSGAVGGATPILETVRRLSEQGRIVSVEGVVNGTTNFILDRLAEGAAFEAAVGAAQARGFAEADPSDDLSGLDAAHKLAIIAADGFGIELRPDEIDRTGIAGLEGSFVKDAAASGRVVRLIASLRVTPTGLEARIAPEVLTAGHPLATVRNEQNGAIVTLDDGRQVFVWGKGAGRWPTTEAVIADLFDIVRAREAAGEETGSGIEVTVAADAAGVAP
jgi:homoserine dehydrogenase